MCAWQYVYGSDPVGEAELGAQAVANGADCLVIDAESQYEGKYAAAQTYIDDLRAKIGPSYPLGLASFPYVYDHESFPYSVFLGPNGAQFNAPQMYWQDIGKSVDTVYANTYIANRLYGRPIFPLGQTYGGVSARRTAALPRGGRRLRLHGRLVVGLAGNRREPVEHARGAARAADQRDPQRRIPRTEERQQGRPGAVDAGAPRQRDSHAGSTGNFDAQTLEDLEAFQTAHGIAASGDAEARHLEGAAGPAADRGRLDRRRAERLSGRHGMIAATSSV